MTHNVKTAVLLVNLGSPLSPSVKHVRRYLRQFLMDKRVIDKPFLFRWLLVNLIIAPFRSFTSARAYSRIWNQNGFPLIQTGHEVADILHRKLGSSYDVFLAMRYQQPSLSNTLKEIQQGAYSRLVVIPLFPQYANATTGSVIEEVMQCIQSWSVIPELRFVNKFYDHPLFATAFSDVAGKHHPIDSYDHFIFSYHGLPVSQLRSAHPNQHSCHQEPTCNCDSCYRAQCLETTERIARQLNLQSDSYVTSFQSRLGTEEWTRPYTSDVIHLAGKAGHKRILVFSPAFVADCLETTIEIGDEYKHEFESTYQGTLDIVPSLNTHPDWISLLISLIQNHTHENTTHIHTEPMPSMVY